MTGPATTVGKRRADFPDAGTTVAATSRDPWDDDPQPKRVSAIPAALDQQSDELARLEGILLELERRVVELGEKLGPVLTMGIPAPLPPSDTMESDPTPEDHRSTIAQGISNRTLAVHQIGDHGSRIAARVSAILEHVEA